LEENNIELKPVKKGPLYNLNPIWFIFLSLFVIFFLYQIIGGTISYMVSGGDPDTNITDVATTRVILSFGQFMFILIPTIFLVMLQNSDFKNTFSLYSPRISILILSVIAIMAIQPFLQVFVYLQNKLIFSLPFDTELIDKLKDFFDMLEAMTMRLVQSYSSFELITVIFVIAITPAICEEFLFRGLVLKNFLKVIPPGKAIFFTGLFFAMFHFHPFNLIPLILLGFFLTYIVYHSGSIIPAIVCHFINNLIAILAVYFYGAESLSQTSISGEAELQYIGLGVFSLVTFVLLIYMIKKYSIKNIPPANINE
jgi:uncharacterized protein